ncbi:MAG: hypothetical protein JW700_03110 [Candidatus Aenigmarchaeota archaeon]|nr:hypothetical protein [Candidatus Aenigmarchaeota archaeon]
MFLEIPEKIKFPEIVKKKGPLAQFNYLKEGKNMKGLSLGQSLDECRWGSPTSILYEANTLEMAEFIKNWMEQNKDNLDFYHGELTEEFQLPYINETVCPRNENHKIKVRALDGTIRCGNEEVKEIKKDYLYSYDFFDKFSKSHVRRYHESNPLSGSFEDEEERLMEKYYNSKDTIKITERCGAILSEKDTIVPLPLLEVLDRINILQGNECFCESDGVTKGYCFEARDMGFERKCFGHNIQNHFIASMSGWSIAANVQRWYEQLPDGKAPLATKDLVNSLVRKSVTPDKVEKETKLWKKKLGLN